MTSSNSDTHAQIRELIQSADLFLFMKGHPDAPQCGFSANVVGILRHINADFKSFNILSDPDIRQAVKEFANWPTYPQLYFKGELLGGNDIVMELFESGELEKLIKAS
jgi:monothiol glutaredoxin